MRSRSFQKIEKFKRTSKKSLCIYIKLYNIHFMKNMTSNLASIVLQYKYKCIYTYIAVCIAGELYVGNLLEFEFQIQHSKLSNFGH